MIALDHLFRALWIARYQRFALHSLRTLFQGYNGVECYELFRFAQRPTSRKLSVFRWINRNVFFHQNNCNGTRLWIGSATLRTYLGNGDKDWSKLDTHAPVCSMTISKPRNGPKCLKSGLELAAITQPRNVWHLWNNQCIFFSRLHSVVISTVVSCWIIDSLTTINGIVDADQLLMSVWLRRGAKLSF